MTERGFPRGVVIAVVAGGKRRPAIVLRVSADGKLLAIAGSTRPPFPGEPAVVVEHESRIGRALRLTAKTWFKKDFVLTNVAPALVWRWSPAVCPSSLMLKLDKLL
jgi:hypothetical protein